MRQGEPINLARDFINAPSEYQRPYDYVAPERLHANDGAYGNEYWAWQGRRRRTQAWDQARRLQIVLGGLPAMDVVEEVPANLTNVTEIEVRPTPETPLQPS